MSGGIVRGAQVSGEVGGAGGAGGVPQVPGALAAETLDPVRERNGFTIVDVTPESMVFRLFGWREPDPLEAIDTLEPYATIAVARG